MGVFSQAFGRNHKSCGNCYTTGKYRFDCGSQDRTDRLVHCDSGARRGIWIFSTKIGCRSYRFIGFPYILPIHILRMPDFGAIDIHGSYLPAYRGPQPVEWQIINGESRCGVTIHRMDRGIDTGEILAQDYVDSISETDTLRTVTMKLCRTGGRLLDELVPQIASGSVRGIKQEASSATYYGRLGEEDIAVDLRKSTQAIYNLIRALPPHFPAFSMIDGVRCYFLQARCINEAGFEAPGTFVKGICPSFKLHNSEDRRWLS